MIVKPIEPFKNPNPNLWKWVLAVLIAITVFIVVTSCEVIKSKKSVSSDSTAVKKATTAMVDTSQGGNVKTNTTKEEFDWYKMTQLFDQHKPAPGDTKVYPTAVIYEGGKGTKESNTVDSSWFKNALLYLNSTIDSLNNKVSTMEKDKKSETKGVGLVFVIIIVIAALVLYALLSGYMGKFKIIKK